MPDSRICPECGIVDGHRGTCSRSLMRSGGLGPLPARYSLLDENRRLNMENAQLRGALTSLWQMELERKMIITHSVPPPAVHYYPDYREPAREACGPSLVFAILGIIFALAVISQLIWAFR